MEQEHVKYMFVKHKAHKFILSKLIKDKKLGEVLMLHKTQGIQTEEHLPRASRPKALMFDVGTKEKILNFILFWDSRA